MTDKEKLYKLLDNKKNEGATYLDSNYCLRDKVTDKVLGEYILIEGNNGRSDGMKGWRKSTLSLLFDMDGDLVEIQSYTPSTKQWFTFFDNRFADKYKGTPLQPEKDEVVCGAV